MNATERHALLVRIAALRRRLPPVEHRTSYERRQMVDLLVELFALSTSGRHPFGG